MFQMATSVEDRDTGTTINLKIVYGTLQCYDILFDLGKLADNVLLNTQTEKKNRK